MSFKRVVITGLGALTPIGNNKSEYWSALLKGVSGAAFVSLFDASKFKTQFACELKGFNSEDFFDRKEARKLDPCAQYGIVAADEAIADSCLDVRKIGENVGVIWGSGIGGLSSFQKDVSNFATGDGTPRYNPFFIPKMIPDITPGHISIKHGLYGPNYATVSACASATNAIIDALTYIRLGKAKAIVAGGSEAAICEAGIGGFNAIKALSERNDSPATASRPFDKDRDGFVLGEGAAALIMEEYEHAKARGANMYAEIIGGGMSADAYHITAPHPKGFGAAKVMSEALKDANILASEVDYVNVHGTSTPLGDKAEILAVKKVFKEQTYKMNISSTKSMIGHLLGAAGAVEAVASILAVKNNIVPPTINHLTDDEYFESELNFTFNKAQKREVNVALSNTFGFGGHNASIIFRKV